MNKHSCQAIIDTLTNAYHAHHFPEEFDYAYDSAGEAKDRRQGQNPMTKEYINQVNARRKLLGTAPLANDGLPTSDESLAIAKAWAEQKGRVTERELTELIYQTLYHHDPVEAGDEHERYYEVASKIARQLLEGESFINAAPAALGKTFGFPRLKNMHLSFLDGAFSTNIIKSFGL